MTRGASSFTPLWAPPLRSLVTVVLWLGLGACGYNNQPANHTQRCATADSAQRCPTNYHCASDDFCWRNGTDPDGGAPIDVGGTTGTGGIVAGTGGVNETGGTVGAGGLAAGGAPGSGGAGGTPVDAGMSKDLSTDLTPLDATTGPDVPQSCTAGQKLCNNTCVAVDDPTYGCDSISCDPSVCPAVSAGTSLVCQGAMCVIGSCPSGTKKCGTKCVSLTDPAYGCGATTCDATACPAVSGSDTLVCQGTSCVVGTCGAGTKKCGTKCVPTDANNGCGDTAKCTACASNEICSGSPTTSCQCIPDNTAACAGKACGPATNNCGQSIMCPNTCTSPNTCGGGSAGVNGCGCTANNTAACSGKACGPATNNCGAAITCPNTCTGANTCNGGGAGVNACGCTTNNTAACTGKACGPATNNCGTAITCPNTCTGVNTCNGGGAGVNACGCAPDNTAACSGKTCGTATNNCGATVNCTNMCGGATPVCKTGANTCVGCNGNGDCSGTKPICSGGTCVQCGGDANCSAPTPRCSSGSCVQCTVNSDCTASYGAGSTCNTTTHTCKCRAPSAGNILTNPGFDSNISGWTSASNCPSPSCSPLPLEVWDGQADADGCVASGSIHLSYYVFAFGTFNQCKNVGPGAYKFGYRFKQNSSSDADAVRCEVDAYAGTGCNTNNSPLSSMVYASGAAVSGWGSPNLGTTFTAPTNTGSILVQCNQQGSLADTWIDQLYLNNAGGGF